MLPIMHTTSAHACFLSLPDDRIMDRLDLKSLISLRGVSATLGLGIDAYLMRRLERLLEKVSDNPHRLREVMRKTASFISGSSALMLISPSDEWPSEPADIDLYVSSTNVDELLSFLCTSEGFQKPAATNYMPYQRSSYLTYHTYIGQDRVRTNSIQRVIKLRHERRGLNIDIVVSRCSNPLAVVAEFDLTCAMNFISSDNIVCLHPDLTLNGTGVMMRPWDTSEKQQSRIEKYTSRGYMLQDTPGDTAFRAQHIMLPGSPYKVGHPALMWCARDSPPALKGQTQVMENITLTVFSRVLPSLEAMDHSAFRSVGNGVGMEPSVGWGRPRKRKAREANLLVTEDDFEGAFEEYTAPWKRRALQRLVSGHMPL